MLGTPLDLFPRPLPDGFVLLEDVVPPEEEAQVIALHDALPMEPYVMRGQASRRRVAFFGAAYDGRERPPVPPALLALRDRACRALGLDPAPFVQALYSRYPEGAGIGWHVDLPRFGPDVVGVSLGTPARFLLREKAAPGNRHELVLPPRSIYRLGGAARSRWEHHLPPVKAERFSVTFRTLLPFGDPRR